MKWKHVLVALCSIFILFSPINVSGEHVVVLPSVSSEMVEIPGGVFTMGMSEEEAKSSFLDSLCRSSFGSAANIACERGYFSVIWKASSPERQVYVSSFFMDRREVTVFAYDECVKYGGCDVAPLLFGDQRYHKPALPVGNIAWQDANQYCRWKGKRLPTEAEWEKAARGVVGHRFPWGNDWNKHSANHGKVSSDITIALMRKQKGELFAESYEADDVDGYLYSAPPGKFLWGTSQYGVHDLAGNVNEWVADFYSPAGYEDLSLINPRRDMYVGIDKRRVVRGGTWSDPGLFLLSYFRLPQPERFRKVSTGFRCAK